MKPSLATKTVVLHQPQAIKNNTALTLSSLDTKGFDQVDILVILGATDIALTVMKLQQSNDDGVADAYADITGSDYGGTGNPALPTATDDNKVFAWHLNNRVQNDRYIKPAITIGNGSTGAYVTVVAILSRAKDGVSSATLRGLASEINL